MQTQKPTETAEKSEKAEEEARAPGIHKEQVWTWN